MKFDPLSVFSALLFIVSLLRTELKRTSDSIQIKSGKKTLMHLNVRTALPDKVRIKSKPNLQTSRLSIAPSNSLLLRDDVTFQRATLFVSPVPHRKATFLLRNPVFCLSSSLSASLAPLAPSSPPHRLSIGQFHREIPFRVRAPTDLWLLQGIDCDSIDQRCGHRSASQLGESVFHAVASLVRIFFWRFAARISRWMCHSFVEILDEIYKTSCSFTVLSNGDASAIAFRTIASWIRTLLSGSLEPKLSSDFVEAK